MSQADLLDQDPVFQLKGSMLAVTILELAHNDLARLERQLADKVAQAPNFFRDTLVMALDKLPEGEGRLDLPALSRSVAATACAPWRSAPGARRTSPPPRPWTCRCCRPRAPANDRWTSRTAPRASLPKSPARAPVKPGPSRPRRKKARRAVSRPTKVVKTPVRGGMQIYAAGGDLIVLAAVGPGAELLADGNIHVYGPMRGRALAGVKATPRRESSASSWPPNWSPSPVTTRSRRTCDAARSGARQCTSACRVTC
ncbi:septum site-determining protein MinC [Pseudomonas aeruginosa]